MNYYLAIAEQMHACFMWRRGCNTWDIAQTLNCPEALVYNRIRHWLARWPRVEERVA